MVTEVDLDLLPGPIIQDFRKVIAEIIHHLATWIDKPAADAAPEAPVAPAPAPAPTAAPAEGNNFGF